MNDNLQEVSVVQKDIRQNIVNDTSLKTKSVDNESLVIDEIRELIEHLPEGKMLVISLQRKKDTPWT